MARVTKYTRKALRAAVEQYFDSITREVDVTEKVDSGKRDSYGHVIWNTVPVKNKLGEVAKVTEYLVPPTLSGLCVHLGIVNSTWSRWRDKEKYPEYEEIMEYVYERLIGWRQEQIVTRKQVGGLIWDMETNFNSGQKTDTTPKLSVVLQGDVKEYAG